MQVEEEEYSKRYIHLPNCWIVSLSLNPSLHGIVHGKEGTILVFLLECVVLLVKLHLEPIISHLYSLYFSVSLSVCFVFADKGPRLHN